MIGSGADRPRAPHDELAGLAGELLAGSGYGGTIQDPIGVIHITRRHRPCGLR